MIDISIKYYLLLKAGDNLLIVTNWLINDDVIKITSLVGKYFLFNISESLFLILYIL